VDSQPPAAAGAPSREEKNFAVLAHLGAFAIALFPPLGHIAAPLLIWLLKGPSSPFIEEHAREALNFQISVTLYAIASGLLVFVLVGALVLPVLILFDAVCALLAATHARRGERYPYPLSIRLIS
jgi:uncharacterized Tic20 family protein